jgi:4-hydroxy-tetrahydrodipicolinate reductase
MTFGLEHGLSDIDHRIDVAIFGAAGRMGHALVRALAASESARLSAAIDRDGSPLQGHDAGVISGLPPIGILIGADPEAALTDAAVAVEFSTPSATVRHAGLAAERGIAYVVGTTGLGEADEQLLRRAAEAVPVVYAANYSIGVTLLADLVTRAAARLGEEFDIEIVEMHHRQKVDAPSGTALALGRAAALGRGVDLDAVAIRGRDGVTGARPKGAIGFAVLRGGDVPGDHTVMFAGDCERLELTHRAGGREIFARGALRAALWAVGRKPGLYTMRNVLGLEE